MDLDERLNRIDYSYLDNAYQPSEFAYEFIAFIKLVNGSMGEENTSPLIHYDMLDQIVPKTPGVNFIQNLFVSFRGSAKALPLSTRIHTPYGDKTLAEIRKGSVVYDRNGEPTTVVAESEIFTDKDCYELILSDGRSITVTHDHINIVKRITSGGKFKEESLTLKEMFELGLFFNRKSCPRNPSGKEVKWYIPLPKPVNNTVKDFKLDPYTVGVILGDGSVGKDGYTRIHTHIDDCDELMSNIPYKTSTVRADKRRPTTLRFSLRGIGSIVKQTIGTDNCYSKKIPSCYMNGSIEQRYEILRGLMDTDGTVSKESCSFSTVSTELAYGVADLVRSLGGRANVVFNRWNSGNSYRVQVMTPKNCFKLSRKANKWKKCKTNKLNHVGIVDVKKVDTVPCKCIAVESPTHSFLAKDYIVTHNTTAIHEYMILYLATYGSIPNFGTVKVGMYISDTMDNGVKSMRNNLEFRWNNSEFLQRYVPEAKFTDVRWEFTNADGKKIVFRGFGASTGVRGFKEYGERPTWCGLDDLMSDKNAESATITRDIKNIVYKAARQAMHPKKRMVNWTGTPFNKSDPLYEAAGSGSWNTRVYPIAEKFPCKKEDFKGAWESRFPYEFVKNEYKSLLASGEIAAFNQELMLRITSDENRLVLDDDLIWYERDKVIKNRHQYNFYITSDLGTSDGKSNDFSVIGVWAYTNNGDWLLVDGVCKRQLMDANINDLFRFVSIYKPLSVGIEINGQQKGFIQWLKNEMITRNIFFNFAKQGTVEGIRRTHKKIEAFKLFVPSIKAKKVWLPIELKETDLLIELVEELRFATGEGFKSKNDDAADMMSMLLEMNPFKPSAEAIPEYTSNEQGTFAFYPDDDDSDNYGCSTIF